MKKEDIYAILKEAIENYCNENDLFIEDEIDEHTPLIGSGRILDSMGLVHTLVNVETAFLDEDVEVSLTSESAMSGRISPFRTVGSLGNFIAKQLNLEEGE